MNPRLTPNSWGRHVARAVNHLLLSDAHKATVYLSSTEVVRATQRLTRGRLDRQGNIDLVVTIGRPNHAERKFIRLCKKAGVSLPLRQVQLKFPPKRKRR